MMRNARTHMMVLPGDGIGPEVIRQAERVLEWFATHRGLEFTVQHGDFGVGAYYRSGRILQDELLADILAADLVLFGAMGGGADHRAIPQEIRLREGLPGVRKAMQVYANIRPVKPFRALAAASPIRADVTEGVDMLVIRELIGGIYFGEPRGIETLPDGTRRGVGASAASPSTSRARAAATSLRSTRRT
jgi:3-isopropylmalate dehydrogenase